MEKSLSQYLKTARCGWCKKPYTKHGRAELIAHFAWRDAYITKLRTVQKMTADDRKKLVLFIKRHTTKADQLKLFHRLRYTYDFPAFWNQRKLKRK